MDRREVLAMAAAALPGVVPAALPAPAHGATRAAEDASLRWPPTESFALWPGVPPDPPAVLPRATAAIVSKPGGYRNLEMRGTARPDIGVFRATHPDGRAVLIVPGGGYSIVSLRSEGIDVARLFAERGITCFVLNYRLPAEGWRHRANVPLSDAQRAMRLIRSRAGRYGIDPAKLGVLGFSAGGHVAASLATLQDVGLYHAVDAADRLLARPAFAGLIYAVSNMDEGRSHGGSRANLLGPDVDPRMVQRYATDRHVGIDTPPLFILHAIDDATVPVQNGIDLFQAARRQSVPVEAHFLQRGGHGFGVRLPRSNPGALWPDLFDRWLAQALAAIR